MDDRIGTASFLAALVGLVIGALGAGGLTFLVTPAPLTQPGPMAGTCSLCAIVGVPLFAALAALFVLNWGKQKLWVESISLSEIFITALVAAGISFMFVFLAARPTFMPAFTANALTSLTKMSP